MVLDITERRQAQEQMRLSEIRYRRLFEAAHDGVLLIDPGTNRIIDANPFMSRLLDYSLDQLIGKELFEIGLLKDEAVSREMFRKLKRSHEVRYEDLPLESQAGRHQEVEVVANLYQEDGRPVIQCNIPRYHRTQAGGGNVTPERETEPGNRPPTGRRGGPAGKSQGAKPSLEAIAPATETTA